MDRRAFMKRALGTTASLTLLAIPGVAYAGQVLPFTTGNAVADMVAAANDNVGMARAVGGRLAVAAGQVAATGAGASIWKRMLGKSPLRTLFYIANAAGLVYEIYRLADGTFSSGQETDEAPAADPSGAIDVNVTTGPEWPGSTPTDEAEAQLAPNSLIQYQSERYGFSAVVARLKLPNGRAAVSVVTYEDGTTSNESLQPYKWISPVETINGVEYREGFFQNNISNPKRITRFKVADAIAPAPTPRQATPPDDIPDNAQVNKKVLAQVLNDAVAQALANDANLRAEVGTPPVITEEMLNDILPANDPIGSVGGARAPLSPPARNPFTGTPVGSTGTGTGSGGDGTGTGGTGAGVIPGLMDPAPDPDIKDPGYPQFQGTTGVNDRSVNSTCPALPNGITAHCAPIIRNRDRIAGLTRLAGYVGVFKYILFD